MERQFRRDNREGTMHTMTEATRPDPCQHYLSPLHPRESYRNGALICEPLHVFTKFDVAYAVEKKNVRMNGNAGRQAGSIAMLDDRLR